MRHRGKILRRLPGLAGHLKPDVMVEDLQRTARAMTDTAAAIAMQTAKRKLFARLCAKPERMTTVWGRRRDPKARNQSQGSKSKPFCERKRQKRSTVEAPYGLPLVANEGFLGLRDATVLRYFSLKGGRAPDCPFRLILHAISISFPPTARSKTRPDAAVS